MYIYINYILIVFAEKIVIMHGHRRDNRATPHRFNEINITKYNLKIKQYRYKV